MLKLHLAPLAKRDVSEIAEYIAKDDFDAANNWLLNLGLEFKKLSAHPRIGRSRQDVKPNLRCWPFGDYSIFYRIARQKLVIVRVISGRRDISKQNYS